jgi:16S rRNA (cytidine1402-2'-O)-methyltransferase
LTRACVENGKKRVFTCATAFCTALVNSGLPNDKFILKDFMPEKVKLVIWL